MRVRDVSEGFGATVGEPVDARITIGDVTLSRTIDGWTVDADGVDLAQLDAVVQLAKHVPAAPAVKAEAVLTIVGEDGSGDTLSDARDLLQRHAETNGGEDAQFGGPDVEFGVGPADYSDPVYSVHVLSEAKLKELQQFDVLKVPIKMLKIGDEYVPDKTFTGTAVTAETYAEWHQNIWPVWKLHEDGFVELVCDGKSARITRRGQILLKQIADGRACVYGDDGGEHNPLRNAQAPRADDSQLDLVDDGAGGSIPRLWVLASGGVQRMIAENGDPKVIADGLWAVAQGLKLSVPDEVSDFVGWACREYVRVDEVEYDIDERIETAMAGPPIPSMK